MAKFAGIVFVILLLFACALFVATERMAFVLGG